MNTGRIYTPISYIIGSMPQEGIENILPQHAVSLLQCGLPGTVQLASTLHSKHAAVKQMNKRYSVVIRVHSS